MAEQEQLPDRNAIAYCTKSGDDVARNIVRANVVQAQRQQARAELKSCDPHVPLTALPAIRKDDPCVTVDPDELPALVSGVWSVHEHACVIIACVPNVRC